MKRMNNIYYFRRISHIGGIETFFRELSKKYQDWDITFYYQYADKEQLKEIRKYCRCIEWKPNQPTRVECDRAFFNFNLDMLDYVDAKEKILVVHGNYKMLSCMPPFDRRLTKVVAVSEDSAKAYTELTGMPCEVCYNPLAYDDYEETIRIICACRLEDGVKGGNRVRRFVEAMDRYCREHNRNYTLEIFTNGGNIDSENVVIRKGRIDIRPYMKSSHYLLQLSDNVEGYNYSVNEMLYLFKKPVIITPCNVYKELGIDETMSIQVNFDMSNINEVVEKIFTKKDWKINYEPPRDKWDELLEQGESTYKEELKMKYRIKAVRWANNLKDNDVQRPRQIGEEWEVSFERLQVLQAHRDLDVVVLDTIDEILTAKQEEKTKKAVRKSTKK